MADCNLIQIEPDDRLVVLARTLQVQAPCAEGILDRRDLGKGGLEELALGHALYRHRSVFRGSSDAPVWSHVDLTYFRGIAPKRAIHELVLSPQPDGVQLLRAEILLTTPSSFVMPRGWQGSVGRSDRQASLEYIDVRPRDLASYRDIMRRHVGPAAGRLVASGRFGTFRAMETAVVLFQDPGFGTEWNQIHLCEIDAADFKGFGEELDALSDGDAPEGGFAGVFAGLAPMRTIPRWTFNDALVEADLALA